MKVERGLSVLEDLGAAVAFVRRAQERDADSLRGAEQDGAGGDGTRTDSVPRSERGVDERVVSGSAPRQGEPERRIAPSLSEPCP
jgi:hypothetical protein